MYMRGAKVGFYSGNIKKLMEDVKELKPTLLIAVPRILYRIYDKVRYCSKVCMMSLWSLTGCIVGHARSLSVSGEAAVVQQSNG